MKKKLMLNESIEKKNRKSKQERKVWTYGVKTTINKMNENKIIKKNTINNKEK